MTESTADEGTRVRIRTAALRQFADHGFKGATVRGIAQEAGVSPGLVQHHFPSKAALRDECDRYVFAYLREAKDQALVAGAITDPGFVADVHEVTVTLTRYLAMALASGSAAAGDYFDAYVELTYEIFTSGEIGPPWPANDETRDAAVVHTAMHLGQIVLFDQMLRTLGVKEHDPDAVLRIGRARLLLAGDRILDEGTADRVRASLDGYEKATRPRHRE